MDNFVIRLLRIVAHDLKNPISAIQALSTLLINDHIPLDDDYDTLKLIRRSSEKLSGIIHDVLSVKINKKTNNSDLTFVYIEELLKESVSLLQYRAIEKKQVIELDCSCNKKIMINRDRIWRVINNLVVNAIKFSHEHSCILVGCKIVENNVIISVKDFGIGIPESLNANLFELSSKSKREGTLGEDTYGLGLFISKEIIEEHGGKIWFESVDQGSTFTFSIPCVQQV